MNKSASVALGVLVVLLLGGSIVLWQKYSASQAQVAKLSSSQDATQLRYSDALTAIAEIQDSLGTLGVAEAQRPTLPGSPEAERGLAVLRGREALDRIALLKAGIERTKARIADLERRAKKSNAHSVALEHIIANLRTTLLERETRIAELSAVVDSLNGQVTGLHQEVATANQTVAERNATIERQRSEIGTVFVVMGTKNDLVRKGAVRKVGGFLGLGETLVPARDAGDTLFTALDTDAVQSLPVPAARARVLTAQPAASYSLVASGKGMELRILDAARFRTVKHVVVLLQP